METAHDILSVCVKNHPDYRDTFTKLIIGSTVLTDYSNKTYRINDVDWNRSPLSTFETKSGPISFVEYYKTVNLLFLHHYNLYLQCPLS